MAKTKTPLKKVSDKLRTINETFEDTPQPSLHLITDADDLGQSIAHIITLEMLRE